METHKLKLNYGNLSKYCGTNREFVKFFYTAKLKDNKVHDKIPKDEITIDQPRAQR